MLEVISAPFDTANTLGPFSFFFYFFVSTEGLRVRIEKQNNFRDKGREKTPYDGQRDAGKQDWR